MDSPTGETRRMARLRIARCASRICLWIGIFASGLFFVVRVLAQAPAPSATVQEAMQQGAEAMTAGNFNAAVTAYTTVTREMPSFAEGYFNLGLAQQQAGQLDDAQSALKKALRLKPDLRGGNLFLGIIAYRQNRYKEAEDDLQRETHVDPRDAKAFMWLGVCHLAQDDAQGAIAPLDKAYALDPSDADILYHRGRAYFLVANASYAAMFKLNYDSVRVHQVLAESYAQAYRNQEAILEFELAVKMAPNLPGLHEELADQYWVMGQADKAGDNYREELRIDPYADTSMYKLGSLLVMHQNPTEGVKLLRDALRADPSLSDAHYYLADGLTGLGQDEDAIHEFELAIAADPTNERAMSAYYRLSQLYRDRHDTANAQTAMQNFLRMRAQNKVHQTQVAAQVVRKRTELPVADPEKTAEPDGQAAN
jgi:tetratricopeptide (TPR) repeat protein